MVILNGTRLFAGVTYTYRWWEPSMDVMRCTDILAGIDTETTKITTSKHPPKGVLAAVACGTQVDLIWHTHWGAYFPLWLQANPTVTVAFFNGAFDMGVIGSDIWIPELAKDNRILEIQGNYPVYRMSTAGWIPGKSTLESVTRELLGVALDKDESIRLSYRPNMELTQQHIYYMIEDAVATYRVGLAVAGMPAQDDQSRAAWVLQDIVRNGFKMDRAYIKERQQLLSAQMREAKQHLAMFGFYPSNPIENKPLKVQLLNMLEDIGYEDLEVCLSPVKNVPAKWWKFFAASLYGLFSADPCVMPSVLQTCVNECLNALIDGQDCKYTNLEALTTSVIPPLEVWLSDIDCSECIKGLGGASPTTKASPWTVLSRIILEAYARGELYRDPELKGVAGAFKESHDVNSGWLSTATTQVSNTQYLQNHVRELMSKYPALKLPLTDGSTKAINEARRAECKAAKSEKRDQRVLDLDSLTKYQVTQSDAWRLADAGINDAFLGYYFEYKHAEKLLTTFVTDKYIKDDDDRVRPRFTLSVKTLRTSTSQPNFQNYPKEPGIREMYIPEPGKLLLAIDYGQEELCALAQHCYTTQGFSVMRTLINAGADLHGAFMAYRDRKLTLDQLHSITDHVPADVSEVIRWYKTDPEGKKRRALGKITNFGLGGNMKAPTFYQHLRANGVDTTLEEAAELIEDWVSLFMEMRTHLNPLADGKVSSKVFDKQAQTIPDEAFEDAVDISDIIVNGKAEYDAEGNYIEPEERVVKLYKAYSISGLWRRRCVSTAACNFPFQSLAAHANKRMLWKVWYTEWLRSTRTGEPQRYKIVNYIHDEIVLEVPETIASAMATEISALMVEAVGTLMPDVKIKVEASLMRRWSKGAEPTYDADGKLIPFEDVEKVLNG